MVTKSNYIQIYIWRSLSIVVGFLSLLVVVPRLAEDPEIFGVYSLCISVVLYFSYADLGFLSAGQKYAAEAFANNDRTKEVEILGFTCAVLGAVMLPVAILLAVLSANPSLIINDLTVEEASIASKMFFAIALALPLTTLFQRITQTILSIRLKDYISARVELVSSCIKIISVFYFFSRDQYRIVEYFYFITAVSFATGLIMLAIVKRAESYDLVHLLKSIRLTKEYYNKLKALAYGSLFATFAWVVFYEIDLLIIGQLFSPVDIAIYSVAFTLINFLRSLFNVLYSPFYPRFNHLVGVNDFQSLNAMVRDLISYTFPLCVLLAAVLCTSANHLIVFWVGPNYESSVSILRVLVVGMCLVFINIPASHYIYAKEKIGYLNTISVTSIAVFSLAVFLLTPSLHLFGIAIAKTLTFLVLAIISYLAVKDCISLFELIKRWLLNLLFLSVLLYFSLSYLYSHVFFEFEKNALHLLCLITIMGISTLLAIVMCLLLDKPSRTLAKIYLNKKSPSIV